MPKRLGFVKRQLAQSKRKISGGNYFASDAEYSRFKSPDM